MPTYTPRLRLTLPGDGESDGTWGAVVNEQITSLIDDAVAGYTQVTVSDTVDTTLTVQDGLPSQSRNMILSLRGTLSATRTVICPAVSKVYIVKNDTISNSPIIFKTSSGVGISVPNGATMILMCDGTDVFNAVTTFGGPTSSVGSFTNLSYSGNFNGAASPSTFSIGNGEFFKSSNGLIGIGTSLPSSKLHVNDSGDNKFSTVLIENSTQASGAGSRVQLSSYGSTWNLSTYAQQNTTLGGTFTVTSSTTGNTVLSLDNTGKVTLPSGGFQASGFATTLPVTITFSATSMVINCALSNVFNLVMSASMIAAPIYLNPQDGQTISIFITQDTVGSRTIIWGSNVKWPGGVAGILSTAASSVDLVVLTYRAFTGRWYATLSKGFV